MFPVVPCSAIGCTAVAVFRSTTCVSHHPDISAYLEEVRDYLEHNEVLADLSLPGITLRGLDLTGKRVHRCNFGRAGLAGARVDGADLRLVFLDFAELTGCSFRGSTMDCAVFAGAVIGDCDFSGSEILRCNFNGVDCRETLFDESDLYASRFVNASLVAPGFRDCNLKQVRFEYAKISGGDFRSSNTEDAFFSEGKVGP